MTLKQVLPIGTSFQYSQFLSDKTLQLNAKNIAHTAKTNRTHEQVYEDALNGLALETALAAYFVYISGYTVAQSTDLVYDLTATTDHGTFNIDVKGRFRPTSRSYTQSTWERNTLDFREDGLKVHYMCFNCTDGQNAVYEGYALSEDFSESIKYTGYYIFSNHLRKS